MIGRTILHVDMNSYFASVSQQYDKNLRNKPVAVMGKGKGTVVIAASKEAKQYGVKTGTDKNDATRLIPEIIFIEPNFAAYVHTTGILMEIFHEFTPLVEAFSIDEAFLDITGTYQIQHGMHPVNFAKLIKNRIRERLGDIITCSIGIADNKLMAKFGSDLKKPDGLVYLTPSEYTKVLDNYPLDDICGIGYRINEHLERLGINSFFKLRNTDYKILEQEFGRVTARFLYHAARGENFSKVDPGKYFSDPKSVSHGETFTENKTGVDLYSDIYKLSEKVSFRLRKKALFTKSISIYLRDAKFNSSGFSQALPYHTNNTLEIFEEIIKKVPYNFVARFVCIYAVDLSKDRLHDLFFETGKKDFLQKAIDKINIKFGHFTILPASVHKPLKTLENNIEIPFSGFDQDAKTGMDMTLILRKDLDIIKKRLKIANLGVNNKITGFHSKLLNKSDNST